MHGLEPAPAWIAVREQRLEQVIGDERVVRGRVESGHARALETLFGTVSVERLAYRAPGVGNLHPSFQDALDAIERQTGQRVAKRQVEELATLATMDFEDFYEARRPLARPH